MSQSLAQDERSECTGWTKSTTRCKKTTAAHSSIDINHMIAGTSCAVGDLSVNSKCYRKFDQQRTWYNASNDCLSRGGSLAVFTDIEHPSRNSRLNDWLSTFGTDKSYWIGLLRSWWKTTNEGNFRPNQQ